MQCALTFKIIHLAHIQLEFETPALNSQTRLDGNCKLMDLLAWCFGSPGGSVTAGLGIYDTMQYILPPIATWCVGQACSMASLLLAAGAPGMRHSLPNARIMIHQPSGGVQVSTVNGLLAVSDKVGQIVSSSVSLQHIF